MTALRAPRTARPDRAGARARPRRVDRRRVCGAAVAGGRCWPGPTQSAVAIVRLRPADRLPGPSSDDAPVRWRGLRPHLANDRAAGRTRPVGRSDALPDRQPSPTTRWHAFCAAVVELADLFEVRLVVGLGAYPTTIPHTRPSRLAASISTPELAQGRGYIRATLDVPAGIQAAIEKACDANGIPAIGLWAQVPHYVVSMEYPEAAAGTGRRARRHRRGEARLVGAARQRGDAAATARPAGGGQPGPRQDGPPARGAVRRRARRPGRGARVHRPAASDGRRAGGRGRTLSDGEQEHMKVDGAIAPDPAAGRGERRIGRGRRLRRRLVPRDQPRPGGVAHRCRPAHRADRTGDRHHRRLRPQSDVVGESANDLQLVSEGRFILGLGSPDPAAHREAVQHAVVPPRPRMREFISAMRAIWDCWHDGSGWRSGATSTPTRS